MVSLLASNKKTPLITIELVDIFPMELIEIGTFALIKISFTFLVIYRCTNGKFNITKARNNIPNKVIRKKSIAFLILRCLIPQASFNIIANIILK